MERAEAGNRSAGDAVDEWSAATVLSKVLIVAGRRGRGGRDLRPLRGRGEIWNGDPGVSAKGSDPRLLSGKPQACGGGVSDFFGYEHSPGGCGLGHFSEWIGPKRPLFSAAA